MVIDMRYRFLEHTADQYIRAFGETLGEAFANGGLAVFETMTDTSKVSKSKMKFFVIEDSELESLLYSFIEQLLIIWETENFLVSKLDVFIVKRGDGSYLLNAKIWGEPFDAKRHESRCGVKAMTYCLMKVINTPPRVVLEFVVDI